MLCRLCWDTVWSTAREHKSLHVRGCKTVFPRRGFQVLELAFGFPVVSGVPDSLSCIPDSKAQDPSLYKQNFPDSLTPYAMRKKVQLRNHSSLSQLKQNQINHYMLDPQSPLRHLSLFLSVTSSLEPSQRGLWGIAKPWRHTLLAKIESRYWREWP